MLSGVAAGVLLAASPALADWQADVQFQTPATSHYGKQGSLQQMKGKAYGRKGLMRMDVQTPAGAMSMLLDQNKGTATNLMHERKLVVQADAGQAGVDLPNCKGKSYATCLTTQGYKKVGSETVNGLPCTVYELERKEEEEEGKAERVKVWLPTGLKEDVIVRSQRLDAEGKLTSQFDLTNVKVAPQPSSRFTVPKDYQPMQMSNVGAPATGARPGALGNFRPEDFEGKTPEQIREMVEKRTKAVGHGSHGAEKPAKK
jgi:hypothetical protein